ncbi:hypothetical protein XI04_03695 [Bradyrhizobium sp. CCBAU 11430]|nr:hypothetical protein [Bradyrhizobium sp. CCBAU 11430]
MLAMRGKTSASQARESMSLSFAVMISIAIVAARSAPPFGAGEQRGLAAESKAAQRALGGHDVFSAQPRWRGLVVRISLSKAG